MKKSVIKTVVVVAVFLLMCLPIFAQEGDVCGYIYSTDILAYVNSLPVPSYNIGGKTAIVLEDLVADGNRFYGIDCDYSDEKRTLAATLDYVAGGYGPEINRGRIGETVGKIYETDIKVILNGFEITGYNIGGKTAVCIEDIGNTADGSKNNEYGYSKYLAKHRWDGEKREIHLELINDLYLHLLSRESGINRTKFYIEDNVITAERSLWNMYYSDFDSDGGTFKNTDGFWTEERVLNPLYLKTSYTQSEQIGICYTENGVTYLCDVDVEKVKKTVEKEQLPQMTYKEILAVFDNGVKYKTLDKCETADYTFIVAEILGSAGKNDEYDWIHYVSVKKDGGFAIVGISSGHYTKRVLEVAENNTVDITVSPFAGTHGTTSMVEQYVLDEFEY